MCIRLDFDQIQCKTIVRRPHHLQGYHEEVDALIAFHVINCTDSIMDLASHTDILVIVVGMVGRRIYRQYYINVIMNCGSGNHWRHIDITNIVTNLELKQRGLATAIPGLNAFVGCDFTAERRVSNFRF